MVMKESTLNFNTVSVSIIVTMTTEMDNFSLKKYSGYFNPNLHLS